MSTSLTVNQLKAAVGWDYEKTTAFSVNSTNASNFSWSNTLANGTGAGKAQVIYVDQLTITTGATTTLDFSGGTTNDPFGTVSTFALIKAIYVEHATSAATGTLELAGSWLTTTAVTGTTPKVIVRPGYCFFLAGTDGTGYPVTNSTGDTLTLKNNDAASVTVKIFVVGE